MRITKRNLLSLIVSIRQDFWSLILIQLRLSDSSLKLFYSSSPFTTILATFKNLFFRLRNLINKKTFNKLESMALGSIHRLQ